MHEHFLQLAIALADDNVRTGEGGPFGAVIVKNNQILASTSNQVTHHKDPTAHAEVMAIRQACKQLDDFQLTDCILYSSCEPCPMCLGAIYWARLQQVYYACSRQDAAAANFDDSFIYQEIAIAPEQRHIAMLQLSVPNATQPFQSWHEKINKVLY